jgi:hypothetical protein
MFPHFVKTAGDDAVESFLPNAVEEYAKLGIRLTDAKLSLPGQAFEFCSNLISHVPVPLNPAKSIYGLVSRPFREEAVEGVLVSLRHWRVLPEFRELLTRWGWVTGKQNS